MQSQAIPMSVLYYCCDAMAVWIIVQAVTGKVMYRRGSAYRQENPRAFWCFIGLESLVVVPMICYQFHVDTVAMVISCVMFAIVTGFFLYIVWMLLWVILHPRETWKKIRLRYDEDPGEFWRALFFGR